MFSKTPNRCARIQKSCAFALQQTLTTANTQQAHTVQNKMFSFDANAIRIIICQFCQSIQTSSLASAVAAAAATATSDGESVSQSRTCHHANRIDVKRAVALSETFVVCFSYGCILCLPLSLPPSTPPLFLFNFSSYFVSMRFCHQKNIHGTS